MKVDAHERLHNSIIKTALLFMLVFPKHNLLLLTPPKTAGKSLKQFFCRDPQFEAHEIVGPVAGNRTSSHTATIPDDYGTMRRAVAVRFPLDRLVSTWHHMNQAWSFRGDPSPSFDDYVRRMCKGDYAGSVFGQTISELLGKTRIDEIVHFERLDIDLRAIGLDFQGEIPHVHSSIRKPWPSYFTPEIEALARHWARQDFKQFGYRENGLDQVMNKPKYLEPIHPRLGHRRDLLQKLPKHAVSAEIGVFCGDFSTEILEVTNPEKLFLIDQWTAEHKMELYGKMRDGCQAFDEVKRKLAQPIDSGQVELRRGRSLEVLDQFPDGFFDWIYLDTSHFFYDTFAELCLCAKKLKPDGFLCGHDYCEIFDFGVVRAVELFCKQFEFEMVYLTAEEKLPAIHRYGINATVPPKVSYDSFALQRISATTQ